MDDQMYEAFQWGTDPTATVFPSRNSFDRGHHEIIAPIIPPGSAPREHHHQQHSEDATTKAFFKHTSGRRTDTDALITAALKKQYPGLEIVVTPAGLCNLLAFARTGNASYETIKDSTSGLPDSLQWDLYIPPARRLDGALGGLGEMTQFGKYLYKWKDLDFIVYLVDGRDGQQPYPAVTNYYILTPDKSKAQQLILEAGRWNSDLHDEVWVFDGGYWQKSKDLYDSVRNATWDSVILSPEMKESIIEDHLSFFSSRETYQHLKVPWKRGIIYYGPPGNGKTISIKAMMHTLYNQKPTPVPTLYVRSLFSVGAISVVSLLPESKLIVLSVCGARVLNQAGLRQSPPVRAVLPGLRGSRLHYQRQCQELLPE